MEDLLRDKKIHIRIFKNKNVGGIYNGKRI